jgi:hypothetical protein
VPGINHLLRALRRRTSRHVIQNVVSVRRQRDSSRRCAPVQDFLAVCRTNNESGPLRSRVRHVPTVLGRWR